MGYIVVRKPITDKRDFIKTVELVSPDVLLLMGIELLDNYKDLVNNVENVLQCSTFGCTILLSRKHFHIYLEYTKTECILYTIQNLLNFP